MKKTVVTILMILLMLSLGAVSARSENAADTLDEWTVMFYFCGSDLESDYGYASVNLKEISEVQYPDTLMSLIDSTMEQPYDPATLPKVNVLIETGGSTQWFAEDLGMHIDTKALQRWKFHCESVRDIIAGDSEKQKFELMDTQPLQSMADPQTLTDFIRWGAQTCPAKKYALVLWDHGGGAKTGIFIDELFDNDVMYLFELKQCLADAGVPLEALIFDACLMANLETAWAVRDSAHWMVASEEVVPGNGTAIREWLRELFAHPECDGRQLGRTICDMTQIKYAVADDEQARNMLTWSVIDLTKTARLARLAGQFFQDMAETYVKYPALTFEYATLFLMAEEYGDGTQHMRDIGGLLYNTVAANFLRHDLRCDMLDALSDMVVYAIRGSGSSGAHGLSFCYPIDFAPEMLDIYAKNCPSPHYLAFLDAVSGWTAPEWVYDRVERLPDISTVTELQLSVSQEEGTNGLPGIVVEHMNNVHNVYYRLYRLDEETGERLMLGRCPCSVSFVGNGKIRWEANDPMHWPSIDGTLCTMELVMQNVKMTETMVEYLYNIPVMIGTETAFLRCGRTVEYASGQASEGYHVYGVWLGYDENTGMPNRNVKALSSVAGQDFRLLYPLDTPSEDGRRLYQRSKTMTMYRALMVNEITLPAGTYYIEYELTDMFLRPTVLNQTEIQWDGTNMTVVGAAP